MVHGAARRLSRPATFHATYEQLTTFLDGWLQERAIGWERTLIGGFSMGCVMSYATGLGPRRPAPAGILAMSGFIPTVDGWEPELETRADLPVFITHGARDPVISVESPATPAAAWTPPGFPSNTASTRGGAPARLCPLPRMTAWVAERTAQFTR